VAAAVATRIAPQISLACALLLLSSLAKAEDRLQKHRDLRRRSGDSAESDPRGPLGTRIASKVAYYTDDDGLTVVTPIISVDQKIFDASSISLEYDADVLSAATVDVRTSATEKFEEVRHGMALAGTHRVLSWQTDLSAALSYSKEYDYESVTVGAGFAKELLQKNVTVGAGYSYVSNRVGRSHTPFGNFEEHLDIHAVNASFTQLLSKSAYLQLSGSVILARGYQASVYRYVPLFSEGSLDPSQLSETTLLDGTVRPLLRAPERLPRSRTRGAGVVRLNQQFPWRMVLAADYRLYADSWSLSSHTISVNLYQPIGSNVVLRLRNRFYLQTKADFYEREYYVSNTNAAPEFYTLDRELSAFWYDLVGLKASFRLPFRGIFERVEFDVKADLQFTAYSDFAYLSERTAVIFGGGLTVEL